MTTKTEKVEEKEPRRHINAIRNDKTPLEIVPDKVYTNMFRFKRANGSIPGELGGLYTTRQMAEYALQTYLQE